jgi:N-methylhydantoinase A
VIYPIGAGVISAVGFLTAPLSFDFVRTFPGPLDCLDWEGVNQIFEQMEAEGRAILSRTVPAEQIDFRRSADLRYCKQGYEVRTPIPSIRLSADRKDEIKTSFEQVYRAIYGHVVADAQIEAVSWRVVAQGPKPNLLLPSIDRAAVNADRAAVNAVEAAVKKTRSVYIPEVRGFLDVPVYDRYALPPEGRLAGPAIVEERESTVVVGQGAEIRINSAGNLIAKLQK